MQDAVDLSGQKSFPGIDKNMALIKHMIKDPTIPKAMRDVFHKHPREMSRWMNALVMLEKGKLQATQRKAGQASQQKSDRGRALADIGVQGTGAVRSKDGSAESSLLDMMVNA
jgi:hypothetical protein